MEERITKENALWEAIPTVPDLQCAWQILLQSANPRANHTMRTMPPGSSASHWQTHDEGIWATAKVLLDGLPAAEETTETESHQLATLPMRMGGLGLRSAVRCAPAAYWASWADALHMISERTPEVPDEVVRRQSLLARRLLAHTTFGPCHFWPAQGVFEGRNPEMCTFGLSGCRVKPWRLRGRWKTGGWGGEGGFWPKSNKSL